ncbi:MAG: CTAG/PCC1 family protein [Desulfurococcaceae archaeon]
MDSLRRSLAADLAMGGPGDCRYGMREEPDRLVITIACSKVSDLRASVNSLLGLMELLDRSVEELGHGGEGPTA